jgi:hypothetical protein
MRRYTPAEENRLRQKVILDATSLMQKLNIQAYIDGQFSRPMGAGRELFGMDRAVQDYIDRKNGHGRIAIMAEMVALKKKRLSTIPPKELSEQEPLTEGLQLK